MKFVTSRSNPEVPPKVERVLFDSEPIDLNRVFSGKCSEKFLLSSYLFIIKCLLFALKMI